MMKENNRNSLHPSPLSYKVERGRVVTNKPFKRRINPLLTVFAILVLGLLTACEKEPKSAKESLKTYKVQSESLHKTLYFTGSIQPIQESTLTSPANAVIEAMHYHYGQKVNAGDVVFTLNSSELQKQYNDTLTEYLKAKDAYSIAQSKFTGTNDLWHAGLLSKNTYLSEKSSLYTSRITLIQATRKLSEMLDRMGNHTGKNQSLSDLSLSEFDKVRRALTSKQSTIYLKSSGDGVLLYPPKSSSDDQSGRLTVGSSIKSGQVLALIGNLTGIRVEIDIPEVDIDKVKPGMPAMVRSVVFPNDALKGELVAINAQASTSAQGALPSFTAIVEVKQLTPNQEAWIKVGMSASVELAVDHTNKLLVPIAAVKQEHGESVVHVQTPDGGLKTCVVTTGAAQADSVIIDSGLQAGDVLVYEK